MSTDSLYELLQVQPEPKLRRLVKKLGLAELLEPGKWGGARSSNQLAAILADYARVGDIERRIRVLLAHLPERSEIVLQRLVAQNVHGYLRIDIHFHRDLTFLVGPNGAGKTSALMLLMGMLTPSLGTLAQVEFRTASLTVEHEGVSKEIRAQRDNSQIRLSVDGVAEELHTDIRTALLLAPPQPEDDSDSPGYRRRRDALRSKIESHPVCTALESISTPMFLGLDRRSSGGAGRRVFGRETLSEHFDGRRSALKISGDVQDVYSLVDERTLDMIQQRSRLETRFRRDILVDAFSYDHIPLDQVFTVGPEIMEQIRSARGQINDALKKLDLQEVNRRITEFYDRVSALERRIAERAPNDDSPTLEWFANRGQIQRIVRLANRLVEFSEESQQLESPLRRFARLANEFLTETGKSIHVSEGAIRVFINRTMRTLSALSSGERQIVVMLAHLSLNPRISDSSVFIVDEPELSLHMSWQERFVRSLQEANPHIQYILATHSPAIILSRADKCVQMPCGER